MGSYRRKGGTVLATVTVLNAAMNKRGISKVIHVIPAPPAFKSEAFSKAIASMFGDTLLQKIESANHRK